MRSITDGADSPTCSPMRASGRPAVVLQHVEDAAVGVVELGFLLVTEYHKAPQGYW